MGFNITSDTYDNGLTVGTCNHNKNLTKLHHFS